MKKAWFVLLLVSIWLACCGNTSKEKTAVFDKWPEPHPSNQQQSPVQVIVLSGSPNDQVSFNLAASVHKYGGPTIATVVVSQNGKAEVALTKDGLIISSSGDIKVEQFGSCGPRCALVATPSGPYQVLAEDKGNYHELTVTKIQ